MRSIAESLSISRLYVALLFLAACHRPTGVAENADEASPSTGSHPVAEAATSPTVSSQFSIGEITGSTEWKTLLEASIERWEKRLAGLIRSDDPDELDEAIRLADLILNVLEIEDVETTPGMPRTEKDRRFFLSNQKSLVQHHRTVAIREVLHLRSLAHEGQRLLHRQQAQAAAKKVLTARMAREPDDESLRDDPSQPAAERVLRYQLRQQKELDDIRRRLGLPIPDRASTGTTLEPPLAVARAETPVGATPPARPLKLPTPTPTPRPTPPPGWPPREPAYGADTESPLDDLGHDPSLPRGEQIRRHQERLKRLLAEHREKQKQLEESRGTEREQILLQQREELKARIAARLSPSETDILNLRPSSAESGNQLGPIEQRILDVGESLLSLADAPTSLPEELRVEPPAGELRRRIAALDSILSTHRDLIQHKKKEREELESQDLVDDPALPGQERTRRHEKRVQAIAAAQYVVSAERYVERLERQRRLIELEADWWKNLALLRQAQQAVLFSTRTLAADSPSSPPSPQPPVRQTPPQTPVPQITPPPPMPKAEPPPELAPPQSGDARQSPPNVDPQSDQGILGDLIDEIDREIYRQRVRLAKGDTHLDVTILEQLESYRKGLLVRWQRKQSGGPATVDLPSFDYALPPDERLARYESDVLDHLKNYLEDYAAPAVGAPPVPAGIPPNRHPLVQHMVQIDRLYGSERRAIAQCLDRLKTTDPQHAFAWVADQKIAIPAEREAHAKLKSEVGQIETALRNIEDLVFARTVLAGILHEMSRK